MGLDGMASARGHRMQGTEHDIAFFSSAGLCHCVALHCIALYAQKMELDGVAGARGHRMQGTEHYNIQASASAAKLSATAPLVRAAVTPLLVPGP